MSGQKTAPICFSKLWNKYTAASVSPHLQTSACLTCLQSLTAEPSPTVWGVSAEWCWPLFRMISFLPREAKRGDQFSGEGWAVSWAAKVAFWAQRTVAPVFYIVSLWGWACYNNDLLTLQLISMQGHSGCNTVWILKQKRVSVNSRIISV